MERTPDAFVRSTKAVASVNITNDSRYSNIFARQRICYRSDIMERIWSKDFEILEHISKFFPFGAQGGWVITILHFLEF